MIIKSQTAMIEKLKVESINKMREVDDDGKRILEKNNFLEQKILSFEIQNNEKNNQISRYLMKFFISLLLFRKKVLKKQIFDVKNESARFEKQVLINQSQNAKVEALKEREDKLSQQNQDYRSQITLLSDKVLFQDNNALDLKNSIKDLQSSINEREDVRNNDNLMNLLIFLYSIT